MSPTVSLSTTMPEKLVFPRILFVTEKDFPVPASLIENDTERAKQEQFRNRATTECTVKYFTSIESLTSALIVSLTSFKRDLKASRRSSKKATHTIFSETRKPPLVGNSAASEVKTRLLFPFVTNQQGFDTAFSVANTSAEPFGKNPTSGSITVYYFGSVTGGGLVPPPQTSASVSPGTLAVFTLSGGGNLGITATPGF